MSVHRFLTTALSVFCLIFGAIGIYCQYQANHTDILDTEENFIIGRNVTLGIDVFLIAIIGLLETPCVRVRLLDQERYIESLRFSNLGSTSNQMVEDDINGIAELNNFYRNTP